MRRFSGLWRWLMRRAAEESRGNGCRQFSWSFPNREALFLPFIWLNGRMAKFPAAIGGIGREFGFCQGADFSMQLQNESLLRTAIFCGER